MEQQLNTPTGHTDRSLLKVAIHGGTSSAPAAAIVYQNQIGVQQQQTPVRLKLPVHNSENPQVAPRLPKDYAFMAVEGNSQRRNTVSMRVDSDANSDLRLCTFTQLTTSPRTP